ncbi:MAG: hypothetical protein ACK6DW_06525 [Betaproteobacteria bacterium]
MKPATAPIRLQLSSRSNVWLNVDTFDGFNADQRMDILDRAADLVDALTSAGNTRVQLRVLDATKRRGEPDQVLGFYDSRRGWYPRALYDLPVPGSSGVGGQA